MKNVLFLSMLLALSSSPAGEIDLYDKQIQADVEFLADDLLEGRGTNQRGYDIAALYIASRYRALGLEPAGENGSYFQTMRFRDARTVEQSISIEGEPIEEIVLLGNVLNRHLELEAPLVFIGYGLEAARYGHDAFSNVDVEGKIVIAFIDDPTLDDDVSGDVIAHLAESRRASAGRNGAVGIIEIRPDYQHDYYAAQPRTLGWIDDQRRSNSLPGSLEVVMTVNDAGAQAMLTGVDRDYEALRESATQGSALPSFEVGRTMKVDATSSWRDFTEVNVLARLPGDNGSGLDDEHVLITAHLDHVGVVSSVEGDNIFNGALDNAAGVAAMLEVARQLSVDSETPRRSVLFAALGVEEQGLMGASYFAANPTVPRDSIVANLNLDMPVPLYRFDSVVAYGASQSTLSSTIAAAAQEMDIALVPDPTPQSGFFSRSDHYVFATSGIPSTMLFTLYPDDEQSIYFDFEDNHLHQPTDDTSLPIDWSMLARYAELNLRITRRLAESDEAPRWREGQFLADQFARD